MKTTLILFMLMAGAAALMPVEIAQDKDAGLDMSPAPVDAGSPDMSPAAAEAAAEEAMMEAQARVDQGADIRRTYAELRVELARLDVIITRMSEP